MMRKHWTKRLVASGLAVLIVITSVNLPMLAEADKSRQTDVSTEIVETWKDNFEAEGCADNWTLYGDFKADDGTALQKNVATALASDYLDNTNTAFGRDLPKENVFRINPSVKASTFSATGTGDQKMYARDAVTMVTPNVWDKATVFEKAEFDLYADISSDQGQYIVFNYVPATSEVGASWDMLVIYMKHGGTKVQLKVSEFHVTSDLTSGIRTCECKVKEKVIITLTNTAGLYSDPENQTKNWMHIMLSYNDTGNAVFNFAFTPVNESLAKFTKDYISDVKTAEENRMVALGTTLWSSSSRTDESKNDDMVIDNFSMSYRRFAGKYVNWNHVEEDTGVAKTDKLISYKDPEKEGYQRLASAELGIVSGSSMRLIYAYTDEDNYHYLEYQLSDDGVIKAVLRQLEDGVVKAENATNFQSEPVIGTAEYTTIPGGIGTGSNYSVRLNYNSDKKVTITFINNNNQSQKTDIEITTTDTETQYFTVDNNVYLYSETGFTLGDFSFVNSELYTADYYWEKYEEVLCLTINTVTPKDKTSVKEALTAYNERCSEAVRQELRTEKELLDTLLQRIEDLELMAELGVEQPKIDKNSSYIYKDDFDDESHLLWYKKTPVTELTSNASKACGGIAFNMSVVEDKQDEDNQLLHLNGIQGGMSPYWFMTPEHSTMRQVSYDVVDFDSAKNYWNLRIYVGYKDADNMCYLDFNYLEEKGWGYRVWNTVGGNLLSTGASKYLDDKLDLAEGFHVEINYDTTLLNANITISSLDDPEISETISTTYGSLQFQFVLPVLVNQYRYLPATYMDIYYDNLSIEYIYGDWDEDLVVDTPIVYYTGATMILPGDTAMISGEHLGTVVKDIEIIELPRETEAFGYILQQQYNALATEGDYTKATDAQLVYEAVLAAEGLSAGIEVEILQRTDEAVQFIIPEIFNPGVYAVKLTPKGQGAPSYVYINRPDIDYTVGDEGEIVTVGGSLRVIGKNLALLSDNEDVTLETELTPQALGVKAIIKDAKGNIKECAVTAVQSVYSLSVQIPDTVTEGSYELSVYNGFGGDSAWAAPIQITVGVSPRETWSDTVFDVTDYGANPAENTIDTYGFINALEAASLNDEDGDGESDGGIVYVPTGIYCITYTIPIPSKVRLVGDGMDSTYIIFSSAHYDFGQLPDAIIALEGDAEVSGLSILSVRALGVISAKNICENVYIDDVRIKTHPYKGTLGNGGTQSSLTSSYLELASLLHKENSVDSAYPFKFSGSGTDYISEGYCKNIQITDCVVEHYTNYSIKAEYLYMADNEIGFYRAGGRGNFLVMNKSIYENNTRGGRSVVANVYGNGYYMDGNELGHQVGNNAEIITTDGGLSYGTGQTGIIEKLDHEDDCHYRFTSGTKYKADRWVGLQVMVFTGQGAYQKRLIVDSYDDVIVLESPFVVEPNRNSRVGINANPRDEWYYVNNKVSSGRNLGAFGTLIGAVYDGNEFSFCEGLYFFSRNEMPLWYISIVNNTMTDAISWHIFDEGDVELTGYGGIVFDSGGSPVKTSFLTIRGNELGGNARIKLRANANDNFKNVTIEDNYMADSEFGILYSADAGYMDGVFVKDMVYTNVKYPVAGVKAGASTGYSTDYTVLQDGLNAYKYAQFHVHKTEVTEEELGDVNMDSVIDETDLKLIRLYLVGRLEFTDDMMERADVKDDGAVNMSDVLKLAEIIKGMETANE